MEAEAAACSLVSFALSVVRHELADRRGYSGPSLAYPPCRTVSRRSENASVTRSGCACRSRDRLLAHRFLASNRSPSMHPFCNLRGLSGCPLWRDCSKSIRRCEASFVDSGSTYRSEIHLKPRFTAGYLQGFPGMGYRATSRAKVFHRSPLRATARNARRSERDALDPRQGRSTAPKRVREVLPLVASFPAASSSRPELQICRLLVPSMPWLHRQEEDG